MNVYDVIILIDGGIGNAIHGLYSVEYCLKNNIKVGLFLNKVNVSFQNYLRDCYGEMVILNSVENVKTKYLIQSVTFQAEIIFPFQYYYYCNPDYFSSKYYSEAEQCLMIVKGIFPSDFNPSNLSRLKEDESNMVKSIINNNPPYLFAPACTSYSATKRWPFFIDLANLLGNENCILVGGNDDLNFTYSYIYPKWFATILPQFILNKKWFWTICKRVGLLKKHAHFDLNHAGLRSYFNQMSWAELVALFRRVKAIVGNDGGLTHLAAAAGAKGLILFGPTSVQKAKPFNPTVVPISMNHDCHPCQFNVKNIALTRDYINCPYGVKCLYEISPEYIKTRLKNL